MFRRGFTLIEIVVVIAIMAILAAITIPAFISIRNAEAFDKDVETVVEVLRRARMQTLQSRNSTTYGVHFESSYATLFSGSVYDPLAGDNISYEFMSKNLAMSITLNNGGGMDVVFNRLSGETANYGTVWLSTQDLSRSKTITIYKTGLIEYE